MSRRRVSSPDGTLTGDSSAEGIFFTEVWSAGSNSRSDSRSSPKYSARTGRAASGDQASNTPPRTAYCPTAVTSPARSYPAAARRAWTFENALSASPGTRRIVAAPTAAASGTPVRSAALGATTTSGYGRIRHAPSAADTLRRAAVDAGSSSSGGGKASARTPHSPSMTRRSSATVSASGMPGVTTSTNGESSSAGRAPRARAAPRASAAAANAVADPENAGKERTEDGTSVPSPKAFSNKATLLLAFCTDDSIPQSRPV